jgi:hypothetical protein
LNIDPSVTPVALKYRRILFHMRKSVEVEIERLLKDDIIEPVTGPTQWLLPAFAVSKKDGNIRLVVDAKPETKADHTLQCLISRLCGNKVDEEGL